MILKALSLYLFTVLVVYPAMRLFAHCEEKSAQRRLEEFERMMSAAAKRNKRRKRRRAKTKTNSAFEPKSGVVLEFARKNNLEVVDLPITHIGDSDV